MANKIFTTGMATSPIDTEFQSGWTPRTWLRAHRIALVQSLQQAGIPTDQLTTCWNFNAGGGRLGEKCVSTDRPVGEPDAGFLLDHIEEYEAEMVNCPPVP